MPLTKKGSKIMSAMKKEYGKKRGEQVFYASRNKGKIKGVEKKMKTKKASLGLLAVKEAKRKGAKGAEFLSPSALAMRLIGRKSGSPRKGETMKELSGAAASESEIKKLKKIAPKFKDNPEDRFGEYRVQEAKSGKMMKLKGGGAAIKGTKFKGVF